MPDTLNLARLEKLLAEATPGPWLVSPVEAWVEIPGEDAPICAMLWPTDLRSEGETYANAGLIALARTALPHLLSRISELESALRGVKAEAIDIAKASAKRCAYKGNNPYIAACLKHRRSDARRIAREIEAIDLDTQARNVLGEKA